MEGCFHIGNCSPKRKRKSRQKHPVRRWLVLVACLILSAALLLNGWVLPQIKALCETEIANSLSLLANEELYRLFREESYTYESFITLSYDANGRIAGASINSILINLLKNNLAIRILKVFCQKEIALSLPLGNMLGFLFLSKISGELAINATVAQSMQAKFYSEFLEAGINQTSHRIGFSLEFGVYYLLPTGKEHFSLSMDVPIAQTLIVGEVPDSLTQISRLSDDVSEIEIDDAVDFGDVVY